MKVSKAHSLSEAIEFLQANPSAKIVAGGTDLIPRINQGIEQHDILLYINDLNELSGIRKDEAGNFFVGASVKLVEIGESPLLSQYTALRQASGRVASPQIRNLATLGGNILQENRCMFFNQSVYWSNVNRCFKLGGKQCFQYKSSPKCVALFQSDVAPVLMAYGATAVIVGSRGEREVALKDLYLDGQFKQIGHDEILTGVRLPAIDDNCRSAYVRYTIRGAFDFPLVSCAVVLKTKEQIVEDVSVVMGSAGVMPQEVPEVKELLAGAKLEEIASLITKLDKEVKKQIAPFRVPRMNSSVRKEKGVEVFRKAFSLAAG